MQQYLTRNKLIKRPGIATGEKHNISTNNRMTESQNTTINYRLNQIIITAETSHNKPCRSFTYLIVDWQTI